MVDIRTRRTTKGFNNFCCSTTAAFPKTAAGPGGHLLLPFEGVRKYTTARDGVHNENEELGNSGLKKNTDRVSLGRNTKRGQRDVQKNTTTESRKMFPVPRPKRRWPLKTQFGTWIGRGARADGA